MVGNELEVGLLRESLGSESLLGNRGYVFV